MAGVIQSRGGLKALAAATLLVASPALATNRVPEQKPPAAASHNRSINPTPEERYAQLTDNGTKPDNVVYVGINGQDEFNPNGKPGDLHVCDRGMTASVGQNGGIVFGVDHTANTVAELSRTPSFDEQQQFQDYVRGVAAAGQRNTLTLASFDRDGRPAIATALIPATALDALARAGTPSTSVVPKSRIRAALTTASP